MSPMPSRCIILTYFLLLIAEHSAEVVDDGEDFFQQGLAAVDTNLGRVIGRVFPEGVRSFLGIPYALPPVGKLRFEPPVPLASWGAGELEALEYGAECVQTTANNPRPPSNLSEDCLFLNVWTPPGAKKGSKLPVMVWLYGGGFQQGASSHPEYNGRRMADKGVIVVSINYRVGALGWMVSVTDNLWGNYGLQDQRLGMEWAHDNIHAFGGDPERVTLFGESAGAMSIGQHLFMDGAGILFHQVVMQSNPIGYRFRSVTVANFLGEAMKRGLDCFDLDCLQAEPVSEVLRVQESLMGVPRSVGDFFSWGPVVTDRNYRRHVRKHQKTWNYDEDEGRNEKKNDMGSNSGMLRLGPRYNYTAPFMNVVQPLEVLTARAMSAILARDHGSGEQGRRRGSGGGSRLVGGREGGVLLPVPVILGVNADEGLMFVHGAFPMTMPKLVYYSFVTALFRTSVVRVLHAYGHLADQCEESGDYRRVMSQIMHDYLFRCPTLRAAQLLQEQNGRSAPVFVYQFSHPTEVPGFPECSGSSCHTAELPFVFNNLEVISGGYSYHETSGPAAPPRKDTREDLYTVEDVADDNSGGGGSSGVDDGGSGDDGDGALVMVGHVLGGVASGVASIAGGVAGAVAGAARGGFGVGRLFNRGGDPSTSVGDNLANAIGQGAGGSVLPERSLNDPDEEVQTIQTQSSCDGDAVDWRGISSLSSSNCEERLCEGTSGGSVESAAVDSGDAPMKRSAECSEDVAEGATSSLSALSDQKRLTEMNKEGPSQLDALASHGVDPIVKPCSDAGGIVKEEGRATNDNGRLVEDQTRQGSSGVQEGNRATGEGGVGTSNYADVAVEAEPLVGRKAAAPGGGKGSLGSGSSGSGPVPPRPTALQAAEADALVGDAMVNYWAAFGKAGDPNSANAPVLWPAWEGRRLSAQGGPAGSVAIAAMLASGRGGVGKGSFSDVFADAWSQVVENNGVSTASEGAWEGTSYFLEIKDEPEVLEARRDCLCEFWDRLKYRH